MRFAIVLTAVLVATTGANAATLNFESFNVGDEIDFVTFSDGTTATVLTDSDRSTGNGGTDQAGIYGTAVQTGNDDDLVAPFDSASGGAQLSPGKILIILGPDNGDGVPDDDLQGGTITFTFSRVVDLLSFDYFDTESGSNALNVTATGYAIGPLITGNHEYETYNKPLLGITSVTFDFGGSGALDNLRISPIPLPAALPLFLTGLAGLGLVGWRKRRRVQAAA